MAKINVNTDKLKKYSDSIKSASQQYEQTKTCYGIHCTLQAYNNGANALDKANNSLVNVAQCISAEADNIAKAADTLKQTDNNNAKAIAK
ncbi:MAG: hypothetical protein K6B67_03225 [Lachnospiraceae bacterium]|nr:hypothetical protein [Lachnospiraceae bacterium]